LTFSSLSLNLSINLGQACTKEKWMFNTMMFRKARLNEEVINHFLQQTKAEYITCQKLKKNIIHVTHLKA